MKEGMPFVCRDFHLHQKYYLTTWDPGHFSLPFDLFFILVSSVMQEFLELFCYKQSWVKNCYVKPWSVLIPSVSIFFWGGGGRCLNKLYYLIIDCSPMEVSWIRLEPQFILYWYPTDLTRIIRQEFTHKSYFDRMLGLHSWSVMAYKTKIRLTVSLFSCYKYIYCSSSVCITHFVHYVGTVLQFIKQEGVSNSDYLKTVPRFILWDP